MQGPQGGSDGTTSGHWSVVGSGLPDGALAGKRGAMLMSCDGDLCVALTSLCLVGMEVCSLEAVLGAGLAVSSAVAALVE